MARVKSKIRNLLAPLTGVVSFDGYFSEEITPRSVYDLPNEKVPFLQILSCL